MASVGPWVKNPMQRIYDISGYIYNPIKIREIFSTQWTTDNEIKIDNILRTLRDLPSYYAASKESKKWWPSWGDIPRGIEELVKINAELRRRSIPIPNQRPILSDKDLEELKRILWRMLSLERKGGVICMNL